VSTGSPLLRASVCICTRDRPEELGRALASAIASRPPTHQIVVADDSDGGESERLVRGQDADITYVRGPRTGLGANRNAAIDAAEGDFLLFLDDDAVLGESYLATMEAKLETVPPAQRSRTILAGTELNRGRTVVPNEQDLLGFQSRPYRQGEELRTVVINAALFPRGLFDQVRFDPRLKYGLDEVDLTTQAVARGYRIVPCFEASNSHFPSTLGREGYGEAAVAARLYVTLKRRRFTEGSRLRGWSGFGLAAAHSYLAACKRYGPRAGTRLGNRTLRAAWRDYEIYKRRRGLSGEGTVA
jgi:glycosyltransferase involved in cell wall biosynthesis